MNELLKINSLDVKFDTDEGRITAVENVSLLNSLQMGFRTLAVEKRSSEVFHSNSSKPCRIITHPPIPGITRRIEGYL